MSAGSHLRLPQALASLGQSAAPIGPIFDEERARSGRPCCPGVDRVQAPPLCDGQARHLLRVGAEDHRHVRSSQCPQLRSHEAAAVAQAAGVRHVNRKARDGLGALQERRPLHAAVVGQRLKGRRQARRHARGKAGPMVERGIDFGRAALARCFRFCHIELGYSPNSPITTKCPTRRCRRCQVFVVGGLLHLQLPACPRPATENGLRRVNCAGAAASAGAAWWWRVRQDHHLQADPTASRLWFQR